jgi:hypothetical protein
LIAVPESNGTEGSTFERSFFHAQELSLLPGGRIAQVEVDAAEESGNQELMIRKFGDQRAPDRFPATESLPKHSQFASELRIDQRGLYATCYTYQLC